MRTGKEEFSYQFRKTIPNKNDLALSRKNGHNNFELEDFSNSASTER